MIEFAIKWVEATLLIAVLLAFVSHNVNELNRALALRFAAVAEGRP